MPRVQLRLPAFAAVRLPLLAAMVAVWVGWQCPAAGQSPAATRPSSAPARAADGQAKPDDVSIVSLLDALEPGQIDARLSGWLADPATVDQLVRILEPGQGVDRARQRLLEALARTPESLPVAIQQALVRSAVAHAAAAAEVRRFRDRLQAMQRRFAENTIDERLESQLIFWLRDEIPDVATTAIAELDRMISNRQTERITGPIRQQLRTLMESGGDARVRAEAVRILGQLRDQESIPIITRLLADGSEPDASVRLALLLAAGPLGVESALPALLDGLADPDSRRARAVARSAAQWVQVRGTGGAELDALARGLAQRWSDSSPADEDLRQSLISAMAAMAHPRYAVLLDPLRTSLTAESSVIRAGSVQALAALGRREDVQRICQALQDADPTVRRLAADVLGRHRHGSASLTALLHAAQSPVETDPAVREAAARAIGLRLQAEPGRERLAWIDQHLISPISPVTAQPVGQPAAITINAAQASLQERIFAALLEDASLPAEDPLTEGLLARAAVSAVLVNQFITARDRLARAGTASAEAMTAGILLEAMEDRTASAVDLAAAWLTPAGNGNGAPAEAARVDTAMQALQLACGLLSGSGQQARSEELAGEVLRRLKPAGEWKNRFAVLNGPPPTTAPASQPSRPS